MKIFKTYKIQALAAIMAALCYSSCSDKWDEHYGENSEGIVNATLWEAISGNADLTNFAKVAKACGYDLALDGSQTFTVFAPTNSSLSAEQADSLVNLYREKKAEGVKTAENPVVKQFLQNHIALYKQSVSSVTSDSLVMMNGKYQPFSSSAIGGESYETKNELYNNGILYTINGKVKYEPNVFEYLAMDHELDSVYQFINRFGKYEFDANQSVPGSIVDGKTQYLDSVMVYNNRFFDSYGELNAEDSTYWLLAPTNAEWKRMVEEYTPYFNFDTKVENRDSLQYTLTRLMILNSAIFNRSGNKDEAFRDSAVCTMAESDTYYTLYSNEKRTGIFYRPFDAGGIFEGTQDIALSNGHVRKASNFRITPYDNVLKKLLVEAESTFNLDTLDNAIDPYTVRNVPTNNPFYGKISNNSFAEIAPKSLGSQPTVTFNIDNVLSKVGYDIYVVFAPALAYDTLATDEQRLPVKFKTRIGYQASGATVWERPVSSVTKPDVLDTVKVKSNYKFKTSGYGLSQGLPKIKIFTDVSSNQTSKYQTTMRIDCIIVRPHDAPVSEAREIKISY